MNMYYLFFCLFTCHGMNLIRVQGKIAYIRHSDIIQNYATHFLHAESCLANGNPAYVVSARASVTKDVTSYFLQHKSANSPIVLLSENADVKSLNAKALVYFIDSVSNLNSTLNQAVQRKVWDTEKCVVFIICTVVDDILWVDRALKSIWNVHVLNFVVLYYYKSVEIISFNPFLNEKYNFHSCNNYYFPDKLNNMNGYTLNITTSINPPLSEYKDGTAYGTDISVLLAIMERMNATVKFSNTIVYPDTDFEFTSSVMNNMNFNASNHLYPFKMDDVVILVPKSKHLPQYKYVFRIFTQTIWLLISISFLLVVLICVGINHFLDKGKSISYCTIFFNVTRILLTSPILLKRILPPIQVILVLWAYLCVVLTTAFNSILTSVLITPKYSAEINTISDLIQSDLGIISDGHFLNALNEQLGNIKGNVIITTKSKVVKSLFRRETKLAHVLPFSSVVELNVLDYEGKQIYHLMQQRLVPSLRTYNIKGESLYVPKMNDILFQLFANGIISHIESKNGKLGRTENELSGAEVLELSHLSFAFFLLLAGFIISCIAFATEMCLHRYKYNNFL